MDMQPSFRKFGLNERATWLSVKDPTSRKSGEKWGIRKHVQEKRTTRPAFANPSSGVFPPGHESLLQLTQDLRPGLSYDAPPGLIPAL
jgi:hypothetical protein